MTKYVTSMSNEDFFSPANRNQNCANLTAKICREKELKKDRNIPVKHKE